ncbi:MAG: hypothetical protein JWO48_603 [Bryobacterales bacterium]|nr:hypothetical protein [Bryobacterales bacterium]
MKTRRTLLTTAVLSAVLTVAGGTAHAQTAPACLPGINAAFAAHSAQYTLVSNALGPKVGILKTQLGQVVDQATYATLLATSHALANSIANGRLVITVPDGTVVVDTGKPDDPATTLPAGNSYQHFQAKTVNENHNSRVAIFSAQQWPCGFGLESKLSTSTGVTEHYVAVRLGNHLDSIGTARLSTH